MIEHLRAARAQLSAPGGGFAMTETEVRGIPVRVFSSAPADLRAIFELCALWGDRDYLVFEDERLTYAEVATRVRALAAVLAEDYGVGPGSRVALAMRNYPEWVIGYWAAISLGAAAVGMNAWWTTAEMDYALDDSRPSVLIADDERLARVAPVLDRLRANAALALIAVRTQGELPGGSARWEDLVEVARAPGALPPAPIDPDGDATIFYTSGTTGHPKGAQLTHRGSVQNILNMAFMTLAATMAEEAAIAAGQLSAPTASPIPAGEQMVFLASTPLFHVTACNCVLHPCTVLGGKLVLLRRWEPGRALELIERERVTSFSGVPTMSRELLAHPDWGRRDLSSLRGIAGGGAPVQPDLVRKIDDSLSDGAPVTGYGLTETTGIITANYASFYLAKPQSCGPVVPTMDAKLVDDAGHDLPAGAEVIGELCVRGPNVIRGYLNRPEATAAAIRDGWLHTGDVARIDEDGFVYIVDRIKDMVLRGGENVYCSEVETAIHEHPAVAEAAVFGIPDERLGEDVAAVVVVRPGAVLDAAELTNFLRGLIAAYKIPARVWVRDQPLPRNATGKFVKRELRAQVLAD